jgi:hypothetical protein
MTVAGDVNLNDGGTFTTTLQTVTPTQNRTISFPDATGTVGLVAGSSGQLVANQSGAYAGVANSSVDNATGNVTLGSRFISTVNGAADAPPVRISGTWFAGTSANSLPALYVSPAGTSAGTSWSASGTGIGVNAPAAFGGNLLDLQVNGTSLCRVASSGALIVNSNISLGGVGDAFVLSTRGRLTAAADGVFLFRNNAQTDFNRLQLGGSTSSFPSLKRNSTDLQARLADDSGYTTIDAQLRAQGTAPAATGSTGTAGDIRYDADYIYVCTATNTWKRAALATW